MTRALLVHPQFRSASFWNYRDTCELMDAKYPAAPLGLCTVAAMLPGDWELRLVDRNVATLTERDLDWVLHCNARGAEKAMLVVWNPTGAEVARPIPLDLTFAGFGERVVAVGEDGIPRELRLDPRARASLPVAVQAGGCAWFSLR